MLKAGAGERRRIGMPDNGPRNRQAVEHGELGLDQRCQLGVGMMHEPAGGVHVLADMVKPKTGRVALKPIKHAMAQNLDRPDPSDRNRQQQIG